MDTSSYPVRFLVKWLLPDGRDFYWKSLCVIYDAESLGYLERLFKQVHIEFKTERV